MSIQIRTKAAALATIGALALTGATISQASAQDANVAAPEAHLRLWPSSPALARCFPHATAKVDVHLTTDAIGKDSFTIEAKGLRPRTDFTVFLLEQAGSPFGAAEYIGDFTTDWHGRAANRFDLIVEEAFAFNNVTHARTDLNSVGVWFADEKDDDECLGAHSPVTGFDGDGAAGVQMLNSRAAKLP
jgi:hypothetical protein